MERGAEVAGSDGDVRRRMLNAAREELLSPEYDVLAGIFVTKVAKRAGVPERTAKRLFKSHELRDALMEDLLRVRPGEDIDTENLIEFAGRIVDRSRPLADELGEIVDIVFEHNVESELFRSSMAFWALGRHDSDVQDRLRTMYQAWLRDSRNGLNAMVAQHQDCFQLRQDWISMEDFVRATIALHEGLAIQESIRRDTLSRGEVQRSDLPEMDDQLPHRIVLAVFASMIDSPSSPAVEEIFGEIERRR